MTEVFNRALHKSKRQVLRNNMPPAEQLLWARLRRRQLEGIKFRRQYGVGRYVVDFYSPEIKLAIEVDGESHLGAEAQAYDAERQAYIESFGIRFLRFNNQQIYEELDSVIEMIVFDIQNHEAR
jgi:very-short-patch-repair endonuclease